MVISPGHDQADKQASEIMFERFQKFYADPKPGKTLIVGSKVYPGREDRRRAHKDAVGWDMLPGEGVDRVVDLSVPVEPTVQFDHVECVSVLEHCQNPFALAANIEAHMVPGATILFSVPFVWRPHAYPNDYWRFTIEGVKLLFKNIEWQTIRYGSFEITEGLKAMHFENFVWHARTEVWGFGVKKN